LLSLNARNAEESGNEEIFATLSGGSEEDREKSVTIAVSCTTNISWKQRHYQPRYELFFILIFSLKMQLVSLVPCSHTSLKPIDMKVYY
jgi:hypothetical protein